METLVTGVTASGAVIHGGVVASQVDESPVEVADQLGEESIVSDEGNLDESHSEWQNESVLDETTQPQDDEFADENHTDVEFDTSQVNDAEAGADQTVHPEDTYGSGDFEDGDGFVDAPPAAEMLHDDNANQAAARIQSRFRGHKTRQEFLFSDAHNEQLERAKRRTKAASASVRALYKTERVLKRLNGLLSILRRVPKPLSPQPAAALETAEKAVVTAEKSYEQSLQLYEDMRYSRLTASITKTQACVEGANLALKKAGDAFATSKYHEMKKLWAQVRRLSQLGIVTKLVSEASHHQPAATAVEQRRPSATSASTPSSSASSLSPTSVSSGQRGKLGSVATAEGDETQRRLPSKRSGSSAQPGTLTRPPSVVAFKSELPPRLKKIRQLFYSAYIPLLKMAGIPPPNLAGLDAKVLEGLPSAKQLGLSRKIEEGKEAGEEDSVEEAHEDSLMVDTKAIGSLILPSVGEYENLARVQMFKWSFYDIADALLTLPQSVASLTAELENLVQERELIHLAIEEKHVRRVEFERRVAQEEEEKRLRQLQEARQYWAKGRKLAEIDYEEARKLREMERQREAEKERELERQRAQRALESQEAKANKLNHLCLTVWEGARTGCGPQHMDKLIVEQMKRIWNQEHREWSVNSAEPGTRATLLHLTAMHGHAHLLGTIVAHGASVNVEDHPLLRQTPLHYAVRLGHGPVVRELLRLGANTSLQDSAGDTALHYAVRRNNMELIRMLLPDYVQAEAHDPLRDLLKNMPGVNTKLVDSTLAQRQMSQSFGKSWNKPELKPLDGNQKPEPVVLQLDPEKPNKPGPDTQALLDNWAEDIPFAGPDHTLPERWKTLVTKNGKGRMAIDLPEATYPVRKMLIEYHEELMRRQDKAAHLRPLIAQRNRDRSEGLSKVRVPSRGGKGTGSPQRPLSRSSQFSGRSSSKELLSQIERNSSKVGLR